MKLEIAEGYPTNNAEIDRAGGHGDGNGQLGGFGSMFTTRDMSRCTDLDSTEEITVSK